MLILKTRFYIICTLSYFEYDLYLEKVFTLNSMADSLEYLERKQPPVGKKPHRLGYPGVFGSSRCSQDLEALPDSAGPGPPRLHTQDPGPSGSMNNCKGLFCPNYCGKQCTSYNKLVC